MSEKQKKAIIGIGLGIIIIVIILFLIIKGCSASNYEITFDSDGGSAVNSVVIKENDKVEKPADPTKDGYTFGGWYYNNELFDFDTKITKDMTLKAKWIAGLKGISLNISSISLAPNDETTLSVIFDPIDATSELEWSSSDTSVVQVDSKGVIKGLKKGKATITVKTKDGKYSAKCTVTVTDDVVSVVSVKISGNSEVTVGSTIKLSAKVNPTNASNKAVKWSSSDKKIATVDANGNVKGIKEGTVTITVTTEDGSKTDTKKITVKAKSTSTPSTPSNPGSSSTPSNPGTSTNPGTTEPKDVKVTKITISATKTEMTVGEHQTLKITIEPTNATNKTVTWASSNPSAVKVNSSTGEIEAVGEGSAVITATATDGSKVVSNSITITVNSTYTIILDPIDMGGGIVANYSYKVYKNDSTSFTGYSELYFNNNRVWDPEYIQKSEVKTSGNTATMKLDGKTITLTVKVNTL